MRLPLSMPIAPLGVSFLTGCDNVIKKVDLMSSNDASYMIGSQLKNNLATGDINFRAIVSAAVKQRITEVAVDWITYNLIDCKLMHLQATLSGANIVKP